MFPDAGSRCPDATWSKMCHTLRQGTDEEYKTWADRKDSPDALWSHWTAHVKGRPCRPKLTFKVPLCQINESECEFSSSFCPNFNCPRHVVLATAEGNSDASIDAQQPDSDTTIPGITHGESHYVVNLPTSLTVFPQSFLACRPLD